MDLIELTLLRSNLYRSSGFQLVCWRERANAEHKEKNCRPPVSSPKILDISIRLSSAEEFTRMVSGLIWSRTREKRSHQG